LAATMVIGRNSRAQTGQTDLDEQASLLVLDAFREESRRGLWSPFDAALDCYIKKHPHLSRELAGHAVANILANGGF
jgi:hypothetical protein